MYEGKESAGGMRRVWNRQGCGSRVTITAHGGRCTKTRTIVVEEARNERGQSSALVSSPGSSKSMLARHSSASGRHGGRRRTGRRGGEGALGALGRGEVVARAGDDELEAQLPPPRPRRTGHAIP